MQKFNLYKKKTSANSRELEINNSTRDIVENVRKTKNVLGIAA